MNKNSRITILAFALLFSVEANAQRILGYLPSYRDPSAANIQYDKVTDVVYSFVNPNSNGTLNFTTSGAPLWNWDNTRFLTCKNNANSNGVNLWVALGGADPAETRSARMNSVTGNATFRANLINDLITFAVNENLYGLAIDWEFPKTTAAKNNHEVFMQELYAAIQASANPNIKVACAVGAETTTNPNHTQYINNNTFDYIDEIHLMCYDFPASADVNHSSYADAVTSLQGWALAHNKFDIDKVLLGVPFYGRNAARSLELEYNNFGGTPATNFVNDEWNGYYYNGRPTLESKIDLINNEGGLGVLIWDMGQDRSDQYSLLTAMESYYQGLCPIPSPNLGPDQGICLPASVVLDCNVSTSAGRTFTWLKDGVTQVNQSSTQTTFTATAGGSYEVVIEEAACSRSDQILIVEGNGLSTTGDSRCGPGTVNLTVNTAGGPYDWYDAPSGGTVVHTGNTYSPSVTTTTTYYVQDGGTSTTYTSGKDVMPAANWVPDARLYGQLLTVETDLTIESVRLWPQSSANVYVAVVSVLDGTTELQTSSNVSVSTAGQIVPLNFQLTPGDYFITVKPQSGSNTGILVDPAGESDYNEPGVFTLSGAEYGDFGSGFSQGGGPTTLYGQLFDWKITTGVVPPCGRKDVTATVNPVPSAPGLITGDATVCVGDNPVSYSISDGGMTYSWSYDGPNGTLSSTTGTSIDINFTGETAGDYVLSVTADDGGGCGPSTPTTFDINVDPCLVPPTADFTGSANGICTGDVVTFTDASSGDISTYSWDFDDATASPTTASTAGPHDVTFNTPGTYNISLTVTGPGGSDTETKNGFITVLDPPTSANAGSPQSTCLNNTTLSGNTPSNGSGQWTLVSGTGTITNATSPNTTVTGLGVGANVFRWTITAAPQCSPSTDDVTITRTGGLTASDAGPNQSLCASSANLAANTPGGGETGTWTVSSGTGTFSNANDPTATVSGLSVGANIFIWTISNGSCPDETDEVEITREEDPTASNAGADQTVCATNATLAGNTPSVGSGTWTVVSGAGTFGNASSPTSSVTGLGAGANVFEWTISNGSCAPSSSTVTITQSGSMTASNAGIDQSLCSTSTSLEANTVNTGNSEVGTWTVVSGTGTFSDANDPTTSVSGLSDGDNIFKWTISNGACTPSEDEVTITKEVDPSTAEAGADQNVCASSTTLGADVPSIGTGVWTVVSGSGTFGSASDPSSTVTGLGAGANIFQWEVSNGSCPTSTDVVTITQSGSATTAAAGSDQNVCADNATLAGNAAGGGETGTWTLVSGAGSITSPNSESSAVTGLGIGDNTFRWTIDNGSCAATSDDIVITRDENPTTATAGSDQSACATSATLDANTATVGSGLWTVSSGTGTFADATDPTTTVSGLSAGANVFTWTISNGSCTSSSDQVTITQSGSLTAANAGSDQSICVDNTSLSGNAVAGGETGTWVLISGSGTITSANNPTTTVTGLGMGANVFEWSIDNGVCAPSSDQVTITQDAAATTAAAGPDQNVCGGTGTLAGNVPSSGTGAWSIVSGSVTLSDNSSATSSFSGLGSGQTATLRWTITNGCGSNFDDVVISENCTLDADFTANKTQSCTNSTIVFSDATTGATGSATYSWNFGANATPATANGIGPHSVTYSTTGFKDVALTVTDGSSNVETKASYIEIITKPAAPVISGNNFVVCNASGEAYSVPNNVGSIYNWGMPGGATLVSGQGSSSISVNFGTTSGSISVVEASNGCISDAALYFINVCATPVEDKLANSTVNIYPNPFTNEVNIEISSINDFEYNLIVLDLNGRIVHNASYISSSTTVVGADLPAGIYFARVITGEEVKTVKLVKQ